MVVCAAHWGRGGWGSSVGGGRSPEALPPRVGVGAQADTYRRMQTVTGGDWASHQPRTNAVSALGPYAPGPPPPLFRDPLISQALALHVPVQGTLNAKQVARCI